MAEGDTLEGLFGGFSAGSMMPIVIGIFAAVVVFSLVGFFAWWMIKKRINWNLKVEFKLPRSDGKMVNSEWGKGCYSTNRGVVFLKRKRRKKVAMKPFDIQKYLQGEKILTVVQIGAEQYVPVLPESFTQLVDDKTGEEAATIKFKVDSTESKSWRNSFERDSKTAYTIMGLLQQYANFIGWGIILFMNFAGFAILYTKVA